VFTLPVVEASLEDVRALGVSVVAAVVEAGTPYTEVDLAAPVALVVGSEDRGLDDRWRAAADAAVSIPQRGRTVDSLNAAAAAAVLLFEAVRQRG
jgi:tRNA G18 (ribose-2'-O)-methylase SpoU